jgi:hypothetical protein
MNKYNLYNRTNQELKEESDWGEMQIVKGFNEKKHDGTTMF